MANVTLIDGIVAISGKIGDTIYRTTPSGKTIAYQQPSKRTSPPTDKELHQRKCFAIASHITREMLYHPELQKALMKTYKQINSKKRPATLRGYVMALVMDMIKDMKL